MIKHDEDDEMEKDEMNYKIEEIEVDSLHSCNLYNYIAEPHCQPKVIVDMPLLSRLSDKVPQGYYRLGLIYIPKDGLQRPPRYSFVRIEPPSAGQFYLAAIEEEKNRYWVIAVLSEGLGKDRQRLQILEKATRRDLAWLVQQV